MPKNCCKEESNLGVPQNSLYEGPIEVPYRVSIVKSLLEQSLKIVVGFEIFEIAHKTKKLTLQSN